MNVAQHNGQITALQHRLTDDLRSVMSKKRINQSQLAQHCGISQSTLSELLHERRPFSAALLGKLSRVLGDFMATEGRLFTSLRQYQEVLAVAEATREQACFALACGNTGIGKTTALRQLFAHEGATFYIKIEDDISWWQLLAKIANALGVIRVPYRTEARRELLQQRVEQLAMERPLLIIDEAEELSNSVASKLKRLHTLTEGQLGVLIVAHPQLRRRLATASGLQPDTEQPRPGRPEAQCATLWRRLTKFSLPAVSEEDIKKLCTEELGVKSKALIALAQQRWTNYGNMAKDLKVAEAAGLSWKSMSEEEFQFLSDT